MMLQGRKQDNCPLCIFEEHSKVLSFFELDIKIVACGLRNIGAVGENVFTAGRFSQVTTEAKYISTVFKQSVEIWHSSKYQFYNIKSIDLCIHAWVFTFAVYPSKVEVNFSDFRQNCWHTHFVVISGQYFGGKPAAS